MIRVSERVKERVRGRDVRGVFDGEDREGVVDGEENECNVGIVLEMW